MCVYVLVRGVGWAEWVCMCLWVWDWVCLCALVGVCARARWVLFQAMGGNSDAHLCVFP